MGRLTLNVLLSFAQFDSRSWTSASGRLIGGKPFSRGALYLILQNRISRGSGSPEISCIVAVADERGG